MYLILMNPDSIENIKSYYRGAICIMDNKPWYVTKLAKPTLFKTEDETKKEIKKLHKNYPNDEFIDIDISFYLSIIDIIDTNSSNLWINQLKQQQEMLPL